MPNRETIFEAGQSFHIFSHTVEQRNIFDNEADCYRFIFQMYAANIGRPGPNLWRKDTTGAAKALLRGEQISSQLVIEESSPLVSILDFVLNLNHYHLYLVSNINNGIPLYMQKLNGGFVRYFNLKYKRKGFLFNSRYKSVSVQGDFQSDAVSRYINTINVLDVYQPGWRKAGLKNMEGALDFLKNYPFSSFPDRIGERSSKILAPQDILKIYCPEEALRDKGTYSSFIKDFLENQIDLPYDLLLDEV